MIGLLNDPHGGLGVSDGRIELAKLVERFGKPGPRVRGLVDGCPKAFAAQVALECDVPFEEGDRLAEPAPNEVCEAEIGRCEHLDRAIAEGSCDGEGLLSETDCCVVVASDDALDRHEGGNPPQPVLIAKRPREHLRCMEVISHARSITERVERVSEIEVDIDGQLCCLPGIGQTAESHERLLQVSKSLTMGALPGGPQPRLAEIVDRLLPHLPAQGMMGQPLRLLGDALAKEPLDGLGDAGM